MSAENFRPLKINEMSINEKDDLLLDLWSRYEKTRISSLKSSKRKHRKLRSVEESRVSCNQKSAEYRKNRYHNDAEYRRKALDSSKKSRLKKLAMKSELSSADEQEDPVD